MTDIELNIAQNIKLHRKRLALTIEQLASEVGVSRATLSRIENGDVSPTAQVLAKLCLCFDTSLSAFMRKAEQTEGSFIASTEQKVWRDEALGFTRQIVSPPSDDLKGEVIRGELAAHKRIEYETPTRQGLEHHLYVLQGALKLSVADNVFQLTKGDCLRYKTYSSSVFETHEQSATYLLFMV